MSAPARSLLSFLAQVPDPRGQKGRRHEFIAMLATVVCAMLCGRRGFKPIAEWVYSYSVDVWWMLGYHRKPPKWGAFRKLLMRVDATALEQAVAAWTAQHIPAPDPAEPTGVSIDGKALRGSFDRLRGIVMLLSAFDHRTGCVIGQRAVPSDTNEMKACVEFLKELVLKGRILTLDAAFCYPEVCDAVVEGGGHFIITVKDNQPTLRNAISSEFLANPEGDSPKVRKDRAEERRVVSEADKGHGRKERRTLETTMALNEHLSRLGWKHVRQVYRLTRERTEWNREKKQEEKSVDVVYGITSAPRQIANAYDLLDHTRNHWGVENKLHWVRDETMGEDRSRVRTGSAPQAMAAIRNGILNALRLDKVVNVAAALRNFSTCCRKPLAFLGILKE